MFELSMRILISSLFSTSWGFGVMVIIQEQTASSQMHSTLLQWKRALKIEMKMKMLEARRERGLKEIAFAGILRQRSVKQLVQLSLQNKVVQLLQLSFSSLQNNSLNNKRLKIIEQQLKLKQIITTVQKTFMGLKYECIIKKNQQLIEQKQQQQLSYRAFSGWKYQIVLDKTQRQFSTLRQQRDTSFYFNYWLDLQRHISSRRASLQRLAIKKHISEEGGAFVLWKNRCFHTKFIDLLQSHYLVPHHRNIAKRCITSWRKYTKYRGAKIQIHEQMASVSASLTAKRYMREWFERATEDGGRQLSVRIMASRLSRIIQRKRLQSALNRISVFVERQQYLSQNVEQIEANRITEKLFTFFGEWRRRFGQKVLSKEAISTRERKTLGDSYSAMVEYANYSKIKRDITYQTAQALIQVTTLDTRLKMVQSLLYREIQPTHKTLKAFYFFKIIRGLNQQRAEKEKRITSMQFNRFKLFLKAFYSLANYSSESQEKSQLQQRALQFDYQRLGVKILKGFVINTLKQRRYHDADAFYGQKVCTQAIQTLFRYSREKQSRGILKTRMIHLLKKKCGKIFKQYFLQQGHPWD